MTTVAPSVLVLPFRAMKALALPEFMLERRPDDILWDVVEQHLEETTFFWSQWERGLVAPDYSLTELAERVEERLHAHLQGLIFGGRPVAERLLRPVLELPEDELDPPQLTAAALALLEGWDDTQAEAVVARFQECGAAQRAAIQRALERATRENIITRLVPLLGRAEPDLQAAVLEIVAFRGEKPGFGLEHLLTSEEPRLVAGALRIARTQPARTLKPEFLRRPLLWPETRDLALEVAVIHGDQRAWPLCRELVATRRPESRTAMVLLAMHGGRSELELLLDCLAIPEQRRDALWALGFSGHLEAVAACLELLNDTECRRLAGEAFSAITGLELTEQFAREEQEEPREEPIPLEEERLDEDLLPAPEAAIPLPEPEAIRAWWKDARRDFSPGTRYLYGSPLDRESLLNALETAPMRRRHVLALRLAIESRGELQLNTLASTSRQLQQLARARGRHV
ncbi:MAG TPA: TIGR02270 family protein [Archangium sp.]|uniref:TIGR02270 family protein n=1 Tax=Archangium sp. TaxID=1872627 RepID=UPI002E34E8BE|nr:TIGR02270 family protein [Archangium sp.]HEX5749510.1 TIGR02270 family protein [Archangium sp.]